MITIEQTDTFRHWFKKLKDELAVAVITQRLTRLAFGHLGDVKPVGKGISELRIHYGAGYRVYFKQHDTQVIILLVGGNKTSQEKDIKTAQKLVKNLGI